MPITEGTIMSVAPHPDTFMRRVLWAGAVLNAGGAWLFAFLVLLFGVTFTWLAMQTVIHRSLAATIIDMPFYVAFLRLANTCSITPANAK
jgi:hypothetical protein